VYQHSRECKSCPILFECLFSITLLHDVQPQRQLAPLAGRAWQILPATSSTCILNPLYLSYMAYYDVLSTKCQPPPSQGDKFSGFGSRSLTPTAPYSGGAGGGGAVGGLSHNTSNASMGRAR